MDVLVLSYHSADDRNKTQNGSKLYLRSDTYIRSRKRKFNFQKSFSFSLALVFLFLDDVVHFDFPFMNKAVSSKEVIVGDFLLRTWKQ